MSEHESDDQRIAGQLSRFTPDRGALDRDALIFAAGRATANKHRGWKALAGALAASQLLTLVMLWPRAAAMAPSGRQIDVASLPGSAIESAPTAALEASPFQLSTLRQELSATRRDSVPPQVDGPMLPDVPPLRASSPIPPALLN